MQEEFDTPAGNNLFSTIFYQSPLMQIITEAESGKIIDVNERFCQFYGFHKQELLGKTLVEMNIMINPEDRTKIVNQLMTDKIKHDIQVKEKTKSGELKLINVSVSALNLGGKECFLGIGIDITKKKIFENQLKKINADAEVTIHNMQGFELVKVMNIVRCEADGPCTKIILTNDKQLVSTQNLKYYSEQWHGNLFYRTHRKHLVNISHITRYYKGSNGIVIMTNGSSVPVARNEKTAFVKFLSRKSE